MSGGLFMKEQDHPLQMKKAIPAVCIWAPLL